MPEVPAIQKAELEADLNDEAKRTKECEEHSATKPPEWVVSTAGVWHKILHGPADRKDKAAWQSFCGWGFGKRAGNARLEPLESLPAEPKVLCHKCFGLARQELKRAQLVRLRRHIGEGA